MLSFVLKLSLLATMENKNQSHSYTFVPKNKIKEEKNKEEKNNRHLQEAIASWVMDSDSDISESEFDRILEQTKSEKGRKKVID